jgi:hypothetical protein
MSTPLKIKKPTIYLPLLFLSALRKTRRYYCWLTTKHPCLSARLFNGLPNMLFFFAEGIITRENI